MKQSRSLPALALAALALLLAGCPAGGEGSAPAASGDSAPGASARVPVPGQAVLVRGSESVRGVAGFGRNAIPALFGEYAVVSADGETHILSVWFTREALVLDEAWRSLSCSGLPTGFTLAQSGTLEAGLLVVVASTSDYRVVISVPAGFGNPCGFTTVLIERFTFFMRNAGREEDISFPAFLQL
ncbi:MAG: hypothetical protein AB7T74_00950 [Clostridia bacterium]